MKAVLLVMLLAVLSGCAAVATDHAMTCTPARWNVPGLTDCLWCNRGGLVPVYMCREPLDKANDAFKCWRVIVGRRETAMKTVISLALLVGLLGSRPPISHDDLGQLCPVGPSVAVLRGAPWDCKLAAVRTTQARIKQRMQRMEEHLERLERQYAIPQ